MLHYTNQELCTVLRSDVMQLPTTRRIEAANLREQHLQGAFLVVQRDHGLVGALAPLHLRRAHAAVSWRQAGHLSQARPDLAHLCKTTGFQNARGWHGHCGHHS